MHHGVIYAHAFGQLTAHGSVSVPSSCPTAIHLSISIPSCSHHRSPSIHSFHARAYLPFSLTTLLPTSLALLVFSLRSPLPPPLLVPAPHRRHALSASTALLRGHRVMRALGTCRVTVTSLVLGQSSELTSVQDLTGYGHLSSCRPYTRQILHPPFHLAGNLFVPVTFAPAFRGFLALCATRHTPHISWLPAMALPSSNSNPFLASWAPTETPVRRSYNRANNPFTPVYRSATAPLPQCFPLVAPGPVSDLAAAYPETPVPSPPAMQLPPLAPLAMPPPNAYPPQQHSAPPSYPPMSFAAQQLALQNQHLDVPYYTEAPNFKVVSISSSSWTATDFLDLTKRNYSSWSKRVLQTLGMNGGLFLWLDPSHTIPPRTLYPRDHSAWLSNDMAVRSFLQSVSTVPEHSHIAKCTTAAGVWTMLKVRHEVVGTVVQMELLREFFEVRYTNDPSKTAATSTRLSELNDAIWAVGVPDPAAFLTWGMINALSPFPALRNQIVDIADVNAAKIERRLAIPGTFDSSSCPTANAAYSGRAREPREPRELCTTPQCPRPDSHTWSFCIQPGGGMAGKKIGEAQEAQRQARTKKDGKGTSQANSAQGSALLYDPAGRPFLKDVSGKVYYVTDAPAAAPPLNANFVNLTSDPLPTMADFETHAAIEDPHVSLDWTKWAKDFSVHSATLAARGKSIFILFADSGGKVRFRLSVRTRTELN
ncbi:hypothetical protein C8J57DRAFT_1727341 [Mycena rebaudengoi]|nr:hypothetical protein C8J57DRAFT_1727341 [Mycena rebaudengoi]